MKICSKCKEPKEESEFWKRWRKNGKLDRHAVCGKCMGAAVKTYRDKDRPKWREINREQWHSLRREVIAAYGGKCACCSETHYEFLAIDHVDGGGCKHRAEVGTLGVYADAKRRGFPTDYQILCHNCNQAKAWYGECPHVAVYRQEKEQPRQFFYEDCRAQIGVGESKQVSGENISTP